VNINDPEVFDFVRRMCRHIEDVTCGSIDPVAMRDRFIKKFLNAVAFSRDYEDLAKIYQNELAHDNRN
jgi:hypothetical protein